MTKLKNTKKGMAKKALSVSLVAAMLATSNVPVWAAEDLFSDGSTSVEAPTVVEPATDVELFGSGTNDSTSIEEIPSNEPSLNSIDQEQQVETKGEVSIKEAVNGKLDIRTSIPTATSSNIYVQNHEIEGAPYALHVNWYWTDNEDGLGFAADDVKDQAFFTSDKNLIYGDAADVVLQNNKNYISTAYDNSRGQLSDYLGKNLVAVVWQKQNDNNKWRALAISAPVLLVSSDVNDYNQDFSNITLSTTDNIITVDDKITINNIPTDDNGLSIRWYRDNTESSSEIVSARDFTEYTITAADLGHKIFPVVTYQPVEGHDEIVFTKFDEADGVEVCGVDFKWDFNNEEVEGGVAYDAKVLNVTAKLQGNFVDRDAVAISLTGQTGVASEGTLQGDTIRASYTLSQEDIGKTIKATVTVIFMDGNEYTFTDEIEVTDAYVTLEGDPVIKVKEGGADIRPGVILTADVSGVKAPSDPNFTRYSYQWQRLVDGKWINIPDATHKEYTVTTEDYDTQLQVAVFGGRYYNADKSVFSKSVSVKADDLEEKDISVYLQGVDDEITFNPTDLEDNKLQEGIVVEFNRKTDLVAGTDYTLNYIGYEQVGPVTVIVTILPTEKTEYSSGTYTVKDLYTLVVDEDDINDDFEITAKTTRSEYNGNVQTPSITIKTNNGATIVDPKEYTVYSVGPDANKIVNGERESYPVYAYVEGQGMAAGSEQVQHIIEPKDINNHEEDFELVIPDAVWNASKNAVESNSVKNAKIQLFDNAISSTEDLMASMYDGNEQIYRIEALNWGEGGVKKAIRVTFYDGVGNYKGTLTVDGEVNSRSIEQFDSQFTNTIRSKAGDRIYNGVLQDSLGDILDESHGSITFTDGTTLYEGRDFEYRIATGGTNVGGVSYYIEGKGNYDGSMTLSNVYRITEATFNSNQVVDNTDDGPIDFEISYDPSLGDAGADISAYEDTAKELYTAKMASSNYKLTLGKDFWLDEAGTSTWNDQRVLSYRPTVAENKVEGHGENPNFYTEDDTAFRDEIRMVLVEKNLNDPDIQVTIESAEFNGGNLVTPKVKVAYVKDGKEYVINPAYYDVKIVQSAYNQGQTGKVNIVAKEGLDTRQYPQLYTGNQMVDYTVGTTNLALGKIVATNGLETLPSVAYDAAQAGTETGITLGADKYVVKDSSGNIVDPKYYTVSFSDNKAVGTATITVTGKAPYEGSTSATFTITQNNLPSGTLTLMSNDLSKVYTGEGIELVKGTDYNITGELAGLTEGTDYMIVYEDNIDVTDATNKAAIKVVGINNYAGEVVKYFDITPATITAEDITLGEAVYQGGVAVRPEVTVGIPGGDATLTAGTDYTVSYLTPATDAGDEGTVQITYAANKNINTADSVKEVKYTVTAKDLADVTIQAIADQEATGEQIRPEITVLNGSVRMVEGRDYEVAYGENIEVGTGTVTITPVEGNGNYTGSQEASFNIIEAVPEVGQAVISNIRVSGNTVTPVLSGEVDGAVGYDYVISTSDDVTDTASRVDVSKNILNTNTNFYYVETGTYYVYCHAWMRDENGLKVFGEWSNVMPVEVTAVTPERPLIQSARLNGHNLTVTWSRSADATGYDIVMGKAARKVNGEMRPVDYGKAVKKITNGDTVTVTFRNIPSGTYYVGLHAWNRTSESGVKVFSPWSNGRKVVVK